MQAEVVSRETVGEWIKFTVNVMTVYKRGPEKIKRGAETVWVSSTNLQCKCPKLRLHRMYLMVGDENRMKNNGNGLILDHNSIVIPWREKWHRRVRNFQKYELRGAC